MRSYLRVPGDRPYEARGADAVVLDLDGVPQARRTAGVWLDEHRAWVRINAGEDGHEDVRAVTRAGLAGICVPRARSAPELAALGAALAGAEERFGLAVGTIPVVPQLETAAGLLAAAEIARAPRVVRLQLSDDRLAEELRLDVGQDERELLGVRSMLVVASAAARIQAPIGGACADPDRLAGSSRILRRQGFGGRVCLDERQVAVVNEIFANA